MRASALLPDPRMVPWPLRPAQRRPSPPRSAKASTATASSPSSPAVPSSSRSTNGTADRCSLFWTWMSPNLEFATSSSACSRSGPSARRSGRPRWPSCSAPRWARSRTGCSAAGPAFGVPQMIQSRIGVRVPGQHPAGRAERGHRGYRLVRGQQRERHAGTEHADRAAEVAVPGHRRGRPDRDRLPRAQPRARLRAHRVPPARGRLRAGDGGHRWPRRTRRRRPAAAASADS